MNLTTRANACNVPAAKAHLLEVVAGIETDYAIGKADCLDGAVRTLLTTAVNDGGMDVDVAFLCEFALDVAAAFRHASGVTA